MSGRNRMFFAMDVVGEKPEFATSIESAIGLANDELLLLNETIGSVSGLKPDCDKLDYVLAASSGAVCGLFDIFLVAKPGESVAGRVSDKWFSDRVKDFARINGWTEDCGKSPVKFLEGLFDVPYDQTGRGASREVFDLTPSNHHFKSLGHNPTLLGLFFSILDQFQNRSHFVTGGQLISLEKADDGFELRGGDVPSKLFCGFANWFGHLVSDMAGSSSSKGRGMGLPSPFWVWTNDVIAITRAAGISTPDFAKSLNELALEIYEKGYDVRFQAAQAVPVVANEAITRLLYSVRRLVKFLLSAKGDAPSFADIWTACEPFSNPTVKRMLTVAHGTFCLLDAGDATVRAFATGAGTFNAKEFCMRLNVIGVGRFAISLYGEGERAIAVSAAEARVLMATKEKTIVEDYLAGLEHLAALYGDEELTALAWSFRGSGAYAVAFEASAKLADLRNVPEQKVLRNKGDIDEYFTEGGRR